MSYLGSNQPYQRVAEPNAGTWVGLGVGAVGGALLGRGSIGLGKKMFPNMKMSTAQKAIQYGGFGVGGAGLGSVVGQKIAE